MRTDLQTCSNLVCLPSKLVSYIVCCLSTKILSDFVSDRICIFVSMVIFLLLRWFIIIMVFQYFLQHGNINKLLLLLLLSLHYLM